jgi:Transposase DDE domain
VRSLMILRKQLEHSLLEVHKSRRESVWRAVEALIVGRQLCLTALGRSMSGQTSDKHRIKAADRLLGNPAIHDAVRLFYRALACQLLRHTPSPIVAVDWTGAGTEHYVLSAQLCFEGRSLPLYDQVFPREHVGNQRFHEQFLRELATVIPPDCKPVIVTDAGFRTPWFDAVAACGWDFIGRIRDTTMCFSQQEWIPARSLYATARSKPQDLGWLLLTRYKPRAYRLILSKLPKIKGRKRTTRKGSAGHSRTDIKASAAAREPWLLATSLSCNCKYVLHAYGLRMQIEQSFRDRKNYRHGWSSHLARTACPKRMSVLLLVAALASLAVQIVGLAAERYGVQRHFQANTVKKRRVLSFFVLGRCVIRHQVTLPEGSLLTALKHIAARLALNSWVFARE